MGLRHFKQRAKEGDLEACHHLGAVYATDLKDPAEAVHWYSRAAEAGHAGSQYDLGFMFVLGEGTERDLGRGLTLLEQAASQGYCEAMRVLVAIYSGEVAGVSEEPVRRDQWARVLSEHLADHPEDRRAFEA